LFAAVCDVAVFVKVIIVARDSAAGPIHTTSADAVWYGTL
jgi:hypothetical protein